MVIGSFAGVLTALAAALPLSAQSDSLMGAGVPAALARYRADRVRDVRYDLVVNVTRSDTATGRVTIRFNRRRPGDVIVDFRGSVLGQIRVNGTVISTPAFNGAHLRIPDSLTRGGDNRIDAEFSALVAAAGASIIRVKDPADGETYVYTLLYRRTRTALPCFDQPDSRRASA
jgi:aminopeptidase N